MIELSEFQKEVGEWGDRTFNVHRGFDLHKCTHAIASHFAKEADELGEAVDYFLMGACSFDNKAMKEESADCFLILLHLAHLHGFDLLEAAREKMEVNYKRTWGTPDENGVIEHIRG